MAHAWMPEARRIRAETDGGPLGGGAPRAAWLTLGSPAGAVSVQSAAQRLVGEHRPCHLIWDPDTGEMAQLISVLRAGRALGAPDRLDWVPNRVRRQAGERKRRGPGLRADRRARPRLRAVHGRPLIGVDAIMSWLDSWGVARRWPDGQPPAWPGIRRQGRRRRRRLRVRLWRRDRRPRRLGARRPLRRVAGPRLRSRGPRRDRHPPAHRQRVASRAGEAHRQGPVGLARRGRAPDPRLNRRRFLRHAIDRVVVVRMTSPSGSLA